MTTEETLTQAAFSTLAETFANNTDEDKFKALQSLCFVVTAFGERDECIQAVDDSSAIHIRNGLYDVLTNRISKEYLQDALYLASWMLQSTNYGGVWALDKPQFPIVLLQTCRTEICLHLAGYERSTADITMDDDGPIVIKSQSDQKLLINCYHIIECSISNLVHEKDGKDPCWSSLPPETIMNMQKIFYDIFDVIIHFLNRLKVSEPSNDPFVYATFKLFAVWSAEDPEKYKTDFLRLLPLFLLPSPAAEADTESIESTTTMEILIPPLFALEEELSKQNCKLLLPNLVEYLTTWISQHSDLTDILSDRMAYQAVSLLDTCSISSQTIPKGLIPLVHVFQSFQQ